jgi:hypothetical protein
MSSDVKLDGNKVILEGNVGVKTSDPQFALDVADRMRVRQAVETAGIWFHQSKPAQDQAFVGMASDATVGFWGNTGADWGLVMDTSTGNVGIGTSKPGLKLDVADRMRVRQAVETAGIWFHQSKPAQDQAFVGMASDTAVGFWGNTGADWGLVMDTTTGNVGIGTSDPGFKLDVADRMRVRQGAETAGIWFHQSEPAKDQAFVGMASDTEVGFWGNTGAGWGLVMDTTTGNVGLGTGQEPPVAKLEVQGETKCSGRLSIHGQAETNTPVLGGPPDFKLKNVKGSAPSSIVIENDSIRVTVLAETIDLVAEVKKLRAEVTALQKKLGA